MLDGASACASLPVGSRLTACPRQPNESNYLPLSATSVCPPNGLQTHADGYGYSRIDPNRDAQQDRTMLMRKSIRLAIGGLTGFALVAGIAVPASADSAVQTWVINKSKASSVINYSQTMATCRVGSNGSTCTISRGKSATRTITATLGMSRAGVASSLGISSASAVTVSTSCTSPKMRAGQTWSAYPVGDRWSYRIHKRTSRFSNQGRPLSETNEYSGYLSAFNPYSASIYCKL